jgi:hypothetical protein
MKKRINAIILAILCLILMLPACRNTSEKSIKANPEAGQISSFMLNVDDMSFEVAKKDAGEEVVPWTNDIQAKCYESEIIKIRDGFVFNDSYIEAFNKDLTVGLTEFVIESPNAFAELGSQWRNDPDGDETVSIKYQKPVVWYDGSQGAVKCTVPAKIMKFDAVALFSPRGKFSGRPEFEADATANLSGNSVEIEPGVVKISYTLEMKGSGVVRYFNANGKEWIASSPSAWPEDKEDSVQYQS